MPKLLFSLTIKAIAVATYLFLLLFISTTKHIKARTHFVVYLSGMLLWQVYLFALTLTKSPVRALVLYNLLVGAAALANILYFPFVRAFLGTKKHKILAISAYPAALLIFQLGLFGWVIREVVMGKGNFYIPVFDWRIYLVSVVGYTYWGLGVFHLIKEYVAEKDATRKRVLRYFLAGIILVILGTLSNFTALQDYPVDVLCMVANAVLISIALISYRIRYAEEALLKSEDRFRRYFALSLIGMAVSSPEKRWLEVN